MHRRYLHLIDRHGLAAWPADRPEQPIGRFAASDDGRAAFSAWLAGIPARSRHTVLVDLPEDGYALDTLPRTRGADRTALLQRRLARHGRGSPYVAALALGTAPAAARQEQFLLCALTHAEPLGHWLDTFAAHQARVAGVHPVPLVLDTLARRLSRRNPLWQGDFLLAGTLPGGTRYSLFADGRLRHSHQSADTAPETPADLGRIRARLYAHDLIARDHVLRVFDLRPPAGARHPGNGAAGPDIELLPLAPAALCRQLGLPPTHDDDAMLHLVLHTAARSRALPHCAPAAVRQLDLACRRGTAALATGLAAGLAATLAALGLVALDQSLAAERAHLDGIIADLQHRHDRLAASLPHLPASPAVLAALIRTAEQFADRPAVPHALLQRLSAALDAHPAVTLHSLAWRQAEAAAGPAAAAQLTAELLLPPPDDGAAVPDLRTRFTAHLAAPDIRIVTRTHAHGLVAAHRESGRHLLTIELHTETMQR